MSTDGEGRAEEIRPAAEEEEPKTSEASSSDLVVNTGTSEKSSDSKTLSTWHILFSRQKRAEEGMAKLRTFFNEARYERSFRETVFQLSEFLKLHRRQPPQESAPTPLQPFVVADDAATKAIVTNRLRSLMSNEKLSQQLESLFGAEQFSREQFRCEPLRGISVDELSSLLQKFQNYEKMIQLLPADSSFTNDLVVAAATATTDFDSDDEMTCSSLHCHITDLTKTIDSDVTASSSDDEKDVGHRHDLMLDYFLERAWIGSRWKWLQSQVADLEYRIRQSVEICKYTKVYSSPQNSPIPCFGDGFAQCDSLIEFEYLPRRDKVIWLDPATHPVLRHQSKLAPGIDKLLLARWKKATEPRNLLSKRLTHALYMRTSNVLQNQKESFRRANKSLFAVDSEKAKRRYTRRYFGGHSSEKQLATGFKFRAEKPYRIARLARNSTRTSFMRRRQAAATRNNTATNIHKEDAPSSSSSSAATASSRPSTSTFRHKTVLTHNYDLDDVVIDLKITPAQGVQKLPYKEIITPA
ncbi:unnamed protein product [Soboliphyme baturini]|uniref:PH domain-containing protein n=1 Tax=Soboliphyme baturini TaxID=241478 RepID=A0A183J629_9BILA|nr:unnamed protein product [Soboliphyme baturini]